MEKLKGNIQTWISIILLALLVIQIKAAFTQEFEMPSFVHAIDACDMDMDGNMDIIVSCSYQDSLVILFNDGFGNFNLQGYSRITSNLICGSVDDDYIPDIITGKEGYLYFIKNNGDRTLEENIVLMEFSGSYILHYLLDMNGDGWNDLVYDFPNYWGILKNNGNLTFTNNIIGSDGGPVNPSLGFFNNDSLPDILISYDSGSKSQITKYLVNDGNFNFSQNILNNQQFLAPIVSEMNDLIPNDLTLFYNPTNEVHLYENTGNATFNFKDIIYIKNSAGVEFADRADYNLDGFDDFSYVQCFWTGCIDSLYVELNDQNWSFGPAQHYYIGTLNWFRIKSTDLNGDSYPDFYMTGYNDNHSIKILWNNGDGTFSNINPVGVNEINQGEKLSFNLTPNPFSSILYINFFSSSPAIVSLKVIDIFGIERKSLLKSKYQLKGNYIYTWDGTDQSGKKCNPGVYIIVLDINENQYSQKIIHHWR
jgi:hypothetical protein